MTHVHEQPVTCTITEDWVGTMVEHHTLPDGTLHRTDRGPAETFTRADGGREHRWYRHGILHRDDGPAEAYLDPRGSVSLYWYQNGAICRDGDKPASIHHSPSHGFATGSTEVNWYIDGEAGRAVGPYSRSWSTMGWHLARWATSRSDGPCVIESAAMAVDLRWGDIVNLYARIPTP